MPAAAVLNVIQETGLSAVHAHSVPAVTVIVPEPADAVSEALVGDTVYPHPAACVIVTACPATVRTPERATVVGFARNE